MKRKDSLDSIAPRFAVEAHLGELFANAEEAGEEPRIEDESRPIELPVPIT